MFDKDIIINENPEPLEDINADDNPFEMDHVKCWNCDTSYLHAKVVTDGDTVTEFPSSECPKCKALN